MAEFPPVPDPCPFPTGVSHQVIGAEVEISPDQRAFVIGLTLADLEGTPLPGDPRRLALSVPAAAQLARALRKAVKEYLRHTPDND